MYAHTFLSLVVFTVCTYFLSLVYYHTVGIAIDLVCVLTAVTGCTAVV